MNGPWPQTNCPDKFGSKTTLVRLNGLRQNHFQDRSAEFLSTKFHRFREERDALMDQPFGTSNFSQVFVTARISSSARKGTTSEATVSAMDDSYSLEGGILLPTELRDEAGTVYAKAQGLLTIPNRSTDDLKEPPNNGTVARLVDGAVVLQESSP